MTDEGADDKADADPAAMEPGTYGRDDERRRRVLDRRDPRAAMEPGTYGRDDLTPPHRHLRFRALPQWSPALTAGMTARTRRMP